MDPVWSKLVAAAPKWVVSSIQIAYPTHFLAQNLENPQIWDISQNVENFRKSWKIKSFKLVRKSFLHISCAFWGLCNTSNHVFLLFSIPNESPDPRSAQKWWKTSKTSKNKKFQICLEIISTHPRRIQRARDIWKEVLRMWVSPSIPSDLPRVILA